LFGCITLQTGNIASSLLSEEGGTGERLMLPPLFHVLSIFILIKEILKGTTITIISNQVIGKAKIHGRKVLFC
jgi:hypothetical protein